MQVQTWFDPIMTWLDHSSNQMHTCLKIQLEFFFCFVFYVYSNRDITYSRCEVGQDWALNCLCFRANVCNSSPEGPYFLETNIMKQKCQNGSNSSLKDNFYFCATAFLQDNFNSFFKLNVSYLNTAKKSRHMKLVIVFPSEIFST